MTWFQDLAPCGYFGREYRDALAVGWLGREMPYRIGSVEGSILDGLASIQALGYETRRCCGFHECDLCLATGSSRVRGYGNLWVPGDGRVFVAPEMVTHYIEEHGYCPPEEFQQAVLDCPSERESYAHALLNAAPKRLRKRLRGPTSFWLRTSHL